MKKGNKPRNNNAIVSVSKGKTPSCKNDKVRSKDRSSTPNPYFMKEDVSFKDKLNRMRNPRLATAVPVQMQHSKDLNTKKDSNSDDEQPMPFTFDITELKQIQSLSTRLNKSENRHMSRGERSDWYVNKGYTMSTNGVLVPPNSQSTLKDVEIENIIKSNVEMLKQTKSRTERFLKEV